MNNKELLKAIKGECDNMSIRFPAEIEFSTLGKKLQIKITGHAFFNNMQTDGAAFEGWAVCLKAWLPEIINEVELAWNTPQEKEDNDNKWLHFHRFLYRALRFDELYDWFSISKDNQSEINTFKEELVGLQNNSFSSKPELKGEKDKDSGRYKLSETVLEYILATNFSTLVEKEFDLDFIDRQFPVGVKKNGEPFFTGSMSAIDLWGTKNDIVTIIELKYNGKAPNIRVGIISELFMYSCIMRDLLKGFISMPDSTPKKNELMFYENCKKKHYHSINARMLSDKFHPLVNNKQVFDILNHQTIGVADIHIVYYKNTYKLFEIE